MKATKYHELSDASDVIEIPKRANRLKNNVFILNRLSI